MGLGSTGGVRVMMGVKQGDSGEHRKPVRLINLCLVDNIYNCFY